MKLTKRRVVVGLISTAVVGAMTSVTTWALADEPTKTTAAAGPVRLIVGYKTGADRVAATQTLSAAGARHINAGAAQQALAELNATSVQVPAARSAATIAALRSNPNVAYVEQDLQRRAFDLTPNDPAYVRQPELNQVKAPAAWDVTTGSAAVKIAVIDTGVNPVPELADAMAPGYDFVNDDTIASDDVGHGTSVAGLIAAKGNNARGMAGLCWSCEIMPIKVLDSEGLGYDSDIAEGIIWSVRNKAKIINLSLGGPQSTKVLQDAVAYANVNGVLVVAAAGNQEAKGTTVTQPQFPAAYTDVLTVAATARCPQFATDPNCTAGTGTLTPWSFRNASGATWVDVAAPGVVTSLDINGNVSTGIEGTSFAAPIVAGIAGLVKAKNPSYSGWSLANAIYQAAAANPLLGNAKGAVNYGKVDAAAALNVPTDTVAPTSSGITLKDNQLVRGTVAVTPGAIKDNRSGIRNVQLYVNGVAKSYSRNAPFGVSWNTSGYNGTVKLELRAYDKASNRLVLTRTVRVDNVKPGIRITSAPKSGSKISGKVTVKYTASDAFGVAKYQLLINGKVAQTHTDLSPFVFSATAVPKSSTVQIRAYDKAGNSNLSAKYSYTR